MKIELDRIKPSPKPIRTSWDDKAIEDLRWSLMEEGQVEPIGVFAKNESAKLTVAILEKYGSGWAEDESTNSIIDIERMHGKPEFELVWGHRRTEAARRADWKEIDAVVVPQDEVNNLIQAGIENLAGEDMTIKDKIEWYKRLIELGESQSSISRRSTVPQNTLSHWQTIIQENNSGVVIHMDNSPGKDEGVLKIINIKEALGGDTEAKKVVAKKVSEESLTANQTRSVAEAYRDAPTPEVKAQVLKTPIVSRDTSADILRRSINRVEMDTGIKLQTERSEWEKQQDAKKAENDFDGVVKTFLDDIRLFRQRLDSAKAFVKFGKYSPEAAAFTIRKIEGLIDELKNYKESLEEIK